MRKLGLAIVAVIAISGGCRRGMVLRNARTTQLAVASVTAPTPLSEPLGVPMPPSSPPAGPQASISEAIESNAGPSEPWPLSIDEAVQIGLQNSNVLRVLAGSSVVGASTTPYDVATARAAILAAESAFDPMFRSTLYGGWINQPPDAIFGPGLAEPTRRNEASWNFSFDRKLLSGANARVAYNPPLGFLYLPNSTSSTTLNPLNTSNVELSLTQPLLRGAGKRVNSAPIVVAQINADQSAWDFRQTLMASVRSIYEAYWDLQAAQAALEMLDSIVPLMQQVVHIEQERFAAQRNIRADVARAEAQLHDLLQRRLQTQSALVERELRLRNLLGVPPTLPRRLVAVSTPFDAPLLVDRYASVQMAITHNPDVVKQRLRIRSREQQLLVARNSYRPQLDAQGLYRINGVGDTLGSSLSQLSSAAYTDYQTSILLTIPIGRRQAAASIMAAEFQAARERAFYEQAIHATAHRIYDQAREVEYTFAVFNEARARLENNTEWMRGSQVRYENPPPAGSDRDWLLIALNDYLQSLRAQTDAAVEVYTLLSRYNAAMMRLEEIKGTLLQTAGVVVQQEFDPFLPLNMAEQCDLARLAPPPLKYDGASTGPNVQPGSTPSAEPARTPMNPHGPLGRDHSAPTMPDAPREPIPPRVIAPPAQPDDSPPMFQPRPLPQPPPMPNSLTPPAAQSGSVNTSAVLAPGVVAPTSNWDAPTRIGPRF